VIESDAPIREGALFGTHGAQINVTDGRYVYMRAPVEGNKPLYEYTHMPTHMHSLFNAEEMATMTISPPFSFTKNSPLMKIEAMPHAQIPPHMRKEAMQRGYTRMGPDKLGTRLYDLEKDPKQENPVEDREIEDRMIRLMIKLMKENDCPTEQFERMGLSEISG
jgi:hypothetical protein